MMIDQVNDHIDTEIDEETKSLSRVVINSVIRSAIADGTLSLTNDDKKNFTLIKKYLKNVGNGNIPVEIVIDHRDDLLKRARQEKRKSNWEAAVLFYAMFIEHSMNGIISIECRRRFLSKSTTSQIIRETNINAKMTWILDIFDLRPIKKEHLGVLREICDLRNAFVHYKWNARGENVEMMHKFSNIEPSVRYLKKYIKSHACGKQHGLLRMAMQELYTR